MPKLVRFYIRHVLIGFAVAAAFVAMLLWFNVANLWHLISTSDVGLLAAALLWVFHGIVFSGVQFGIAIMRLQDEGESGGRRRPVGPGAAFAVPAPVKSAEKPRHA